MLGILSGGGLRAAFFSLGVLQALQRERGLLFGPRCADYLAAVSGGSYVAASFFLSAKALAEDESLPLEPSPLAPEAPETKHLLRHGRYLVEDGRLRTIVRFAVPGFLNVAALVALLFWVGTMLADFAWITAHEIFSAPLPAGWPSWLEWPFAAVAVVASVGLLRGLFKDGGVKRYLLPAFSGVLLLLTSAPLVSRIRTMPPLARADWWWSLDYWWFSDRTWLSGRAWTLGLARATGRHRWAAMAHLALARGACRRYS